MLHDASELINSNADRLPHLGVHRLYGALEYYGSIAD
jgi:hypothetical protein